MINKCKAFLRKNKLTRNIYLTFYNLYWKNIVNKKSRYIKQNGAETVSKLQCFIDEYNEALFFDMGTLLGFIREGKILGHDLDIDIGYIAKYEDDKKRLREFLIKKGCIWKTSYYIKELGVVEDSFEMNNIKFDVNYYQNSDDSSYCYLMFRDENESYSENIYSVVKLTASKILGIEKRLVYGTEVNTPINPEAYLIERYGDDWRIPKKDYKYWKGPSASLTQYEGKRIVK